MLDLTVIILTYNEEIHIERAINSIADVARDVIIVDSQSTDRTVEIAERLGARVFQHAFESQARQFQWALNNLNITTEWVMRLDADEIIEADLISELRTKLNSFPTTISGINLNRKHIFMGRWIRHGGRYPLVLLRIWRHGKARIEQRWMDEHMILTEGKTVTLNGGFLDYNLNDISFFIQKHNKYATREAVEIINGRRSIFPRDSALSQRNTSASTAIKRFLKENLFNHIPFELSSFGYMFFRLFIQLGFLDGREGIVYHFLQGYWYRFLVGAKVLEYEKALSTLAGEDALVRLAELSGLNLLLTRPTDCNRQ